MEKHTTAEIVCPFIPESWYRGTSTFIAFGRDVHPRYASKFSITDTFNLKIYNFTNDDQGRYMCQGVLAGEYKQQKFIVSLCSK